jgi:hypothetical protein
MHPSSFLERLTDRFDDHPLRVRFRKNEMAVGELAPYAFPDLDDIRRVFENFFIAVPGTPLILLHALAAESVATLRMKISERSERAVETPKKTPAEAFWDCDYSELSPVSRTLEVGKSVPLQNSIDGMPIDGGYVEGMSLTNIEQASREFERIK